MTELNIKNARNILLKNMKSKRMLRHSLAVSEGMKAIARHFGEDEELWGAVGLIHDVDY
ncbi:MAG: HD domain-containing protein, partial [Oscillospiraceae bacterium]|nr:HD domain-containing protein [Oscillospiraceae bacterium]